MIRASLLTPRGRGAIATIGVAGSSVAELLASFFHGQSRLPLADVTIGAIRFGQWRRADGSHEDLVLARLAADRWELNCHGGLAAGDAILADLASRGAEIINWDEWSALEVRDAIAAEAFCALAQASTERTAAILLDQYRGALRNEIERLLQLLQQAQDVNAGNSIDQLLARYPLGMHLTRPWRIVLVGPPNVGKSSLMNRLVGYERSIVFDRPGTTRDVLVATTAYAGWPLEFSDTAGMRTTDDALEADGATRAVQQMREADLVVYVEQCDPQPRWTDAPRIDAPHVLRVLNKCDRSGYPLPPAGQWILTSALAGHGIDDLLQAIVQTLIPQPPPPRAAVPFTPRQLHWLQVARAAIAQQQHEAAIQALRALLGIDDAAASKRQ